MQAGRRRLGVIGRYLPAGGIDQDAEPFLVDVVRTKVEGVAPAPVVDVGPTSVAQRFTNGGDAHLEDMPGSFRVGVGPQFLYQTVGGYRMAPPQAQQGEEGAFLARTWRYIDSVHQHLERAEDPEFDPHAAAA